MPTFLTLAAAVPLLPAGTSFTCTPTRVWDGDGPVWCAEGPRLRIAGVAARERDGSCRLNQPCPSATASASRDALVRLVGRPTGRSREGHVLVTGGTMRCVSNGPAGGSRTGAWCTKAAGVDLSCALVASGTVLRWSRYWRDHGCGGRG
ncbi:thermonuclease family protein [Sphingomonas gellani]|uniref:thermonuclease family protein n=1 Tax=Sphingomonas gellani TaxID=1166340 RepID=UPI000AA2C611|nr:hypothetical protein [Sphingomonas gellani]